jgi:hypothetical protein
VPVFYLTGIVFSMSIATMSQEVKVEFSSMADIQPFMGALRKAISTAGNY